MMAKVSAIRLNLEAQKAWSNIPEGEFVSLSIGKTETVLHHSQG